MTNQNSVSIAVPSANTAFSGALVPRYEYISVVNQVGGEIFVRTDGQAATVDGDYCTLVANGERVLLANMAPTWDQSSTVIPNGTKNAGGQWLGGGQSNPGTSISVITPTGVTPQTTPPAIVTIQGAG